MLDRLDHVIVRYEELERLLADPEVLRTPGRLQEYGRELAGLQELVTVARDYRQATRQLAEARELLTGDDPELAAMAAEECAALEGRQAELEERLHVLLVPRDPNDERDVIVEVRAGTGGDEAAIFAADLFRMYTRYAERKG